MTRKNDILAISLYWLSSVLLALVAIAAAGTIFISAWALLGAGGNGAMAVRLQHDPALAAFVLNGPAMLSAILLLLLVLCILWLLRGIVGRIRRRDPFAPENSRDLFRIALLLFAVELISGLRAAAMHQAAPCGSGSGGIDAVGVIAALVALLLAGIFREGTRLRDDAAGTI